MFFDFIKPQIRKAIKEARTEAINSEWFKDYLRAKANLERRITEIERKNHDNTK